MLPWNLPLVLLAWKIGPALAAGCSVIVKPTEETPLTAPRMVEMAMEAGIPAGVFNVVPGPGPEVANPSAAHGHRRGQLHRSTGTGRLFRAMRLNRISRKSRWRWAARTPPWCGVLPGRAMASWSRRQRRGCGRSRGVAIAPNDRVVAGPDVVFPCLLARVAADVLPGLPSAPAGP